MISTPTRTSNMRVWLEQRLPAWLAHAFNAREKWTNIDWSAESGEWDPSRDDGRTAVEQLDRAQAISSATIGRPDTHMIMLDIDCPVAVIPSSTPGHFHLYIARTVGWQQYLRLLVALQECGIVEPGFVEASTHRKATFLRLPWVKKGKEETVGRMSIDELQSFLEEDEL